MLHRLRTHIQLLGLLLLFTLGVIGQMTVLPPAEASDELLHYTYVELLRAEKRLPDRFSHEDNCTRQESGQPPLTYMLGAVMLELLNAPRVDCDVAMAYFNYIDNPWKTPMDGWNRVDNAISFLRLQNVTEFPQADINYSLVLLRLISLPFGIIAVIGAYGSAIEIFKRQSWALLAAAIFAFMPMMVHVSAYWTNDITSIAFASLIIWSLLRLLRLGATPWRLIGLGLLFGLGGLCKVSVMLLLPGAALAILIDWRNRREPFTQLTVNGFLLGLPILALFAPWVMYGFSTFQDPVGFRTHTDPLFNYNPALTLSQTLPMMPEMYLTYIGKFGFSKMYLHPLTYTAIGVIFLLAAIGYLFTWIRRPSFIWVRDFWQERRAQQALLLLVITLVVFAGFYNWLRQIYFVTGRLMYSAHVPISLAITGGLYLLVRQWPRLKLPVKAYSVSVLGVAGLVLPSIVIYNAVTPQIFPTRGQLPALQGTPIDFDHTLRLLGYQQPSRIINEPIYSMNLCWEVLQTTTRPAAFSLKIIHDGVILADRTSIHGMGRYNSSLWQAGAIFCDEVDIRIDDPDLIVEPQPDPAQVYDILLIMLDAKTQEVDWQATTLDGQVIEYPLITQVVTAAGDMRDLLDDPLTESTIHIPNFADIAGFSINGDLTASAKVSIDLLWHVTGTTSESWSQFIHLNGPNGAVSLADGVPRAGNYPTWGWSVGEYVFDRWSIQLPDPLPSGDYELTIGFYKQSNGERIPITVDGTAAQDNAAILFRFTVP
jgi:4-amino-4-deoxy-L-arabinose transferase-like glycosyltransferase